MDIQLLHRPGNSAAKLTLGAGESVTAEAGAMIAMSADVGITTTTHKRGSGSFTKTVKRLFAGESLFLNHFESQRAGSEVWLGTPLPGDMMSLTLERESLIVQGGSFVACESGIEVGVGWQGFRTLLSGESLFWVKLQGSGKVLLNSFGAVYEQPVDGEFIVDTSHLVAYEPGITLKLQLAGGLISSVMGGEGLVTRVCGKGRIVIQTRSLSGLTGWLNPKLWG